MAYYKCGRVYTTQNSNVVVDTSDGAIANFNTPLSLPLIETKFGVKATQDLNGQSGPYPAGGGKNLLNPAYFSDATTQYTINSDGTITVNKSDDRAWNDITNAIFLKAGTYTLSKTIQKGLIHIRCSLDDYSTNIKANTSLVNTFELSADCYIKLKLDTGVASEYPITDKFQLESGSSATSWAPYSNICPISGVSSVSGYHRGANLFDISTKTDGVFLVWSRGDTYNDAKSIASDYIEVKEGVKYTTNYFAQWCCYDKNKNYLGNIISGALVTTSGNDTKTNTIPSGYGVYYLRLGYRSSLNNNEDMTTKTDIVLSVGNTALSYEAYNGTTTLINLGGTYYGGYVSQDKDGKRELVVTHGIYTFDGTEQWSRFSDTSKWFTLVLENALYADNITIMSDKFDGKTSGGGSVYNEDFDVWLQNISAYPRLYICDSSATQKSDIQTLTNGASVVYPLAEPFTVALPDGEPIKSFPGVNNIFCDTGDTTVKFRKIGD